MDAKTIRCSAGTEIKNLCRVLGALLSVRFECYAVLSDGWYVLFDKKPTSSRRSDLVVHVISSLGRLRRATLVLMVRDKLGFDDIASHLGISVSRAERLFASALVSTRARLKRHGVDLLVPTDPPPAIPQPLTEKSDRRSWAMASRAIELALHDAA